MSPSLFLSTLNPIHLEASRDLSISHHDLAFDAFMLSLLIPLRCLCKTALALLLSACLLSNPVSPTPSRLKLTGWQYAENVPEPFVPNLWFAPLNLRAKISFSTRLFNQGGGTVVELDWSPGSPRYFLPRDSSESSLGRPR
jgi:hypothetical protein